MDGLSFNGAVSGQMEKIFIIAVYTICKQRKLHWVVKDMAVLTF